MRRRFVPNCDGLENRVALSDASSATDSSPPPDTSPVVAIRVIPTTGSGGANGGSGGTTGTTA